MTDTPRADLREQAVAVFDYLHRAGRLAATASALRRPLGTAALPPEGALDRLLHVAWSVGALAVRREATADVLLGLDPDSTVLVHDGALAVVAAALPRRNALRLVRPETGETETVAVRALLGPDGRVPVLTITDAARASTGDPLSHGYDGGYGGGDGGGPGGDGSGHVAFGNEDSHHTSLRDALRQVRRMLRPEGRDLWTIGGYALAVGLTSLVLPLVSQALIDAVSLGVYTNQVIVLGGVIALGMLLNGSFAIVQHYAVDLLQRRVFVRTGLDIARRLPRIRHAVFNDAYAPELVNRFFDTVTFQKAVAKLLLDGLAYTLVAVASLALLAVYSPFFLVISVIVLLFVPLVVFGLGYGGLATSVDESQGKYALARWLEEIGRAQTSFKLYAPPTFVHARADAISAHYVGTRGAHFRVLARQSVASLVFRTIVTLVALGIGGRLVVDGQLSLGQFVAAELTLLSLLAALERLVGMLEHGYDLLTAAVKIGALTDLPTDPPGEGALAGTGPLAVSLRGLSFGFGGRPGPFREASLDVPAGAHIAIVGENGTGRTTLAYLLAGVLRPTRGLIALGTQDLARLDAHALRGQVGLAMGTDELFDGTIEENITMGRPLTFDEVWEAVCLAALDGPLLALPEGLQTAVVGTGRSLPGGVARRIMIARALAGRPRLLVLDDATNGLEPAVRDRIIRAVSAEPWWTIIDTSGDAEALRQADAVFVLPGDGGIRASGTPAEAAAEGSPLARLQPEIAAALRALPGLHASAA